jgi:arylformamidase
MEEFSMRIHDISLTISPDMPVWPGDPKVVLKRVSKISEGANANVSRLELSVHTGTHLDAPNHFLDQDRTTVEQLPLKILTGRAYVLHLPDEVDLITRITLENAGVPPRTRRLLIRTRNSNEWARQEKLFNNRFVGIDASGAEYLAERGVRLVGIDYLSVAPFQNSRPTHEILLGSGIVVVEGLDLSQVSQGRYTLFCLPLKLLGAEGSPARAILVGP